MSHSIALKIMVLLVICAGLSCSPNQNSSVQPASDRLRVRPTDSYRPTDAEITSRADQKLRAHGLQDVRLVVSDGQVTLAGQVDTDEQRQAAEDMVKGTSGVINVDNRIVVYKKPPVNANKPGGPEKASSPGS